ncbi:sugar transferase [Micromonospora sp. NPDC050417]|uniref:sugar transferase n=1 Tax=Micromonospora sp. NPDC050417 TaxID=3364280 RepID=UPI0037B0BD69
MQDFAAPPAPSPAAPAPAHADLADATLWRTPVDQTTGQDLIDVAPPPWAVSQAPQMPDTATGRPHGTAQGWSSPAARIPSAATHRARIVVLEGPAADTPADRLDEEFDVVYRIQGPINAERLNHVLAHCRPRLLLLKHSLDTIDVRLITACLAYQIQILVLARPIYGLLRPARMRRYGGLPWLQLRCGTGDLGEARVKRAVDLALILLASPVLIPLMVLVTVVVGMTGPPLYVQTRVGAGGRLFRLVKFRSMRVGAETGTGPAMAILNDSRVTAIGRLLRRSRLDELPQMWNVLRGDMSLVGPRPERPEFIADFQRLPHYDLRHLIRPGLTGIAQLTGGYAATVEEKLRCDLLYLNCRSLRLDLMLLLLTVLDLVRGFPRG